MRDLFLIGFMLAMTVMGFRRPFLFLCTYIYIDIVAPQRLSFYLLSSIPLSLMFFMASFIGWVINDDKSLSKPSPRQIMMILLLLYCGFTTTTADFPGPAAEKWGWVWKAMVFAIFMPMTLYTRARIEGILLFMLLSISSIVMVGAAKTLAGGGGYGTLNLMVSNNTGMYESSTISTFAVAAVPIILYVARYSTIVTPTFFTRVFWYTFAFGCLLIPIGTQTRTGLLCIALVGMLELRKAKRKFLYIGIMGAILGAAIPMLPDTYTKRMDTIQGYKGDASASTRLAVWKWTIDYAQEHPLGGGFDVYRGNKLEVDMSYKTEDGTLVRVIGYDAGRAFHNAYFEMLGEQGYIGLLLFLMIHLTGVFRMEILARQYKNGDEETKWVAPLASALQHGHLVYLLGSSFVGIAFQPFIYYIVAVEIGFDRYVQTYVKKKVWNPFRKRASDVKAEEEAAAEAAAAEAEALAAEQAALAEAEANPKERRRTQARWGSGNSK